MSSVNLSTVIRPDSEPQGEGVAPAIDAATRAKAVGAAEKFEGFFIGEMLRQMRRSAREFGGDDGVFNSRTNDEMLSMADDLMADALAKQHAFGIADLLLRQMLPAEAEAKGKQNAFKSGEDSVALRK